MRARVGTTLLLLAWLVSTARAADPVVTYANDRVTATLHAVPLADVLRALGAASGADIRGGIVAPRDVTAELDAVPLPEALHRLLGEQNFTVSYGAGDRLKAVVLLGGPEAPPPPASPVAETAPSAPGPAVFPLQLSRAFTRHRPVAVPDDLAAAMGVQRATFTELLQVATGADDGVRRAQATQVVLSALEKESGIRRSFLRTLHRLDAPSLDGIMASESGPRFQEILEYLAAHSREPSLQKKAGIVLEQLRPSPM
jgi:hypothetical protein